MYKYFRVLLVRKIDRDHCGRYLSESLLPGSLPLEESLQVLEAFDFVNYSYDTSPFIEAMEEHFYTSLPADITLHVWH
jgi:hypothetical protein